MSDVTIQKIPRTNQPSQLLCEINNLLDDIRNRAYELFESRGGAPGRDLDDWLQAEREMVHVPVLELAETDKDFQLQLAMPGFDAKDVTVAALPDILIVEGESVHEHRDRRANVRVCEFRGRRLFRRIPLPGPVDVDHVSATLNNGLLHVRAAKANHGANRAAA